MLMDILVALAGLWLAVFVLMPIQVAHSLGPLWTVILVLTIVVAVRQLARWRRSRQTKKTAPSHRKH